MKSNPNIKINPPKNPYTEHKIDVLDRLDQNLVIGTGLKGKKSFEKYFNNLVLII